MDEGVFLTPICFNAMNSKDPAFLLLSALFCLQSAQRSVSLLFLSHPPAYGQARVSGFRVSLQRLFRPTTVDMHGKKLWWSHVRAEVATRSISILFTTSSTHQPWDPHHQPEKRRSVCFACILWTRSKNLICSFPCTSVVIMKAVGGEIGSASALAPKLGPLGLVSILAIISVV